MNKDDDILNTKDTAYTVALDTFDLLDPNYNFTLNTTAGFNGTYSITKEPTDIMVAGKSLKKFMDSVEERLAMLEPDAKLEAEWKELKELGEQYRAKERELKEKSRAWNLLKKRNNT